MSVGGYQSAAFVRLSGFRICFSRVGMGDFWVALFSLCCALHRGLFYAAIGVCGDCAVRIAVLSVSLWGAVRAFSKWEHRFPSVQLTRAVSL